MLHAVTVFILTLFSSLQEQQLYTVVEAFIKLNWDQLKHIPFFQCSGNRFAFIVDLLFPEVMMDNNSLLIVQKVDARCVLFSDNHPVFNETWKNL